MWMDERYIVLPSLDPPEGKRTPTTFVGMNKGHFALIIAMSSYYVNLKRVHRVELTYSPLIM